MTSQIVKFYHHSQILDDFNDEFYSIETLASPRIVPLPRKDLCTLNISPLQKFCEN